MSMIIKRNAQQNQIYDYGNLVQQDPGSDIVRICINPGETDLEVTPAMPWHHDKGYSTDVHHTIGLFCVEADDNAGSLYICDMQKAYEEAPQSLIKECENITALHSASKYIDNGFVYNFKNEKQKRFVKKYGRCERPLIWQNCFYYSEAYTVINLDLERRIQEHCYQEKYIYKHDYRPNDLIIFNNIRYTHRRDASTGVKTLLRFAYE